MLFQWRNLTKKTVFLGAWDHRPCRNPATSVHGKVGAVSTYRSGPEGVGGWSIEAVDVAVEHTERRGDEHSVVDCLLDCAGSPDLIHHVINNGGAPSSVLAARRSTGPRLQEDAAGPSSRTWLTTARSYSRRTVEEPKSPGYYKKRLCHPGCSQGHTLEALSRRTGGPAITDASLRWKSLIGNPRLGAPVGKSGWFVYRGRLYRQAPVSAVTSLRRREPIWVLQGRWVALADRLEQLPVPRRPCTHLSFLCSLHVSGRRLGGSLTGRPPNGPLQTSRPLRRFDRR